MNEQAQRSNWPAWLKQYFPWLFYSFVVASLIIYFARLDIGKLAGVEVSYSYLLLALAIGLLFRYLVGYIWLSMLKGLGASNLSGEADLFYIYAKSWLARYIPGTLPWLLAKIHFASERGVSREKLAVVSLLEGGLQVVVLMALSLAMLSLDDRFAALDPKLLAFIGLSLFGLSMVMIPSVFNYVLSLVYRVCRQGPLGSEHFVGGRTIMKGGALYAVGALISGLSMFFAAKAIYPALNYTDLLFVMGSANLAGAVGMLAVFLPSGLGVREGILLLLLALIMPLDISLLITIATRAWSIVSDLCFFLLTMLINMFAGDQPEEDVCKEGE